MFFVRQFRHIKEGFIGVKRHFAMAISSISAVTITLLMLGIFGVLFANMAYLTKEIEESISLVALIDYDVDKSTLSSIEGTIEEINGINKIEYRTKDEEFDFYNETYPEMADFNEIYREDNPFHDAFIIYVEDGTDLSAIKTKISKINGISSVEDGGSNTYTLINILHSARTVGVVLVVGLIVLAVYLIYNTIKVTIQSRQLEISIMRNVGAKNSYIRAPFLVEGVIIGFFGSLLPIAAVDYGYYRLYEMCGGVLAGVITLLEVDPFLIYISVIMLAIGIIVGYLGSYISVCKGLRLSR